MIKVSKLHEWVDVEGDENRDWVSYLPVPGGYLYRTYNNWKGCITMTFVPSVSPLPLTIESSLPDIKGGVERSLLEQEQERLATMKGLVAHEKTAYQSLIKKGNALRTEIITLEQQRDRLKKKPLWDILLGRS